MKTRMEIWRAYRERIKRTPDRLFPAPRVKATEAELTLLESAGNPVINIRYSGLLPKPERVDTLAQRTARRKFLLVAQSILLVALVVTFIILFTVISKE